MQILVIEDPQMIFRGIWGKTFLLQIFGIFVTPKYANVGYWRPSNDFLGQNKFLQFLAQKDANFGHGRPTIDFRGHLGQNGRLRPATLR